MNEHNSALNAAAMNLSSEEVAATFERLRALKKTCRPLVNSNELAIIMIKAIIAEGWDAGDRIVGTLVQLGFDKQHAGATLGKNRRIHWRCEEDDRYVVLDNMSQA